MNDRRSTAGQEFQFAFDKSYRRISWLFGITESRSLLTVTENEVTARFGPWLLSTTLDNVTGADASGPFAYLKTAGPARLSLADRGLTFATSGRRGVCIRFRDPVPAIDPFGFIRHPNLTVTIIDTAGLLKILNSLPDPPAPTA